MQFGQKAITPPDGWKKRGREDGREGKAWVQTQPCPWNGNNWCIFTIVWGWTSQYATPRSVQTDATTKDEAPPVWQNTLAVCQSGGSVRYKCTSGVHSTSLPKQTVVWVSTVCTSFRSTSGNLQVRKMWVLWKKVIKTQEYLNIK